MSGTVTYNPDGNARSFNGRDAVEIYRLAVLISALRLEIKGVRVWRGGSALAAAKRTTGLRTNNREEHIAVLEGLLEVQKASVNHVTEER